MHLRSQFETALDGNNAAEDMQFAEVEASFTPEDDSNELDVAGASEALDSDL
ncbi:MAG: hypothetical protein P8P83_01725 [Rickettsiaceae bacterium]|nr:hypothetical protein [Rickettsiaceae bacterium]